MTTLQENEPKPASTVTRPCLSVVVPMYEEVENVGPLIEQVHAGLMDYAGPWELICVDDGSADGTGERVQRAVAQYGPHCHLIRFRRNSGQTAAMQAGIDAARGELIATLDGDLQNDPADIPRLVDELLERNLDLICGWRKNRHDESARKVFSRIANRLIGHVTGVRLHDYGCSLKIYRSEVIKEINLLGEMHRFIPVWIATVTSPSRIGESVVNHRPRIYGDSKYNLSRTFRVLLDLLSAFFFLKFRARPGHFFGYIGLVTGALGSGIMAWLLVEKFGFGEDIGTRPLLIVGVLLLLSSVQFITTGVLAELLSRTFFASHKASLHPIALREVPKEAGWKTPSQD